MREKYNEYITDITDKMRHSLALYANILLKRHNTDGIPNGFLETDLSAKQIKLVLVVKNAQDDWLIPLKEKLDKELKRESRIWNFTDFYVINEERARKKHFVIWTKLALRSKNYGMLTSNLKKLKYFRANLGLA